MCEYCLNKQLERNTYQFHGISNCNFDGQIKINEDNQLLFECSWIQEIIPREKYEQMGLAAKALIRYCPWCGEKLRNE